jgi:hypothetical protein
MSPTNALEEAIIKAGNAGEDLESKRQVLEALVRSRVAVILDQPWNGESLPSTDTQLLLVTDGANAQQAMLAVFSSLDRAKEFLPGAGPFRYPVEVDAQWAILGIPKDAGIMINPNQAPGFRVNIEVAGMMREFAENQLQQRINRSARRPQQ